MSKAQWSPLSTRSWRPQTYQPLNSPTSTYRCLTQEEKEKVMKQLGEIVSQLSHLRLDKIGSLFEEEGRYVVKDCLSPGFVLPDRYTLPDINRGPFLKESDYYGSLLSAFLLHIQHLRLGHHIFFAPVPVPTEYNSYASYLSATDRWNDFVTVGSKVDSSKNRLDYFIAGRFLEGMISSFTIKSHELPNGSNDGFPIRHPDLSANNIFVDDDCNITCVIDWTFASSVPMAELLTTPGLPHPKDDTELSLTAAFRAGFTTHFGGEESKMLHPAVWGTSRKVWLFTRLINLDALQDYNHFKELYALTFGEQTTDIPALFREQHKKAPISNMAKFLEADDQPPSAIQRKEKAYFSCVGSERHALSRKLTLASALNRGFVADRNLWQWVENAAYTSLINDRQSDIDHIINAIT